MDTETMIKDMKAEIPNFDELMENQNINDVIWGICLPCQIGQTVYVIHTCRDVDMELDGTMYDSAGGPGTATGYYCPYEMNDSCPHDYEDSDGCEKYYDKMAVFEDEIQGYGIHEYSMMVYTKRLNMAAYLNEFGERIFFTREQAEKAFEKMKGAEINNGQNEN